MTSSANAIDQLTPGITYFSGQEFGNLDLSRSGASVSASGTFPNFYLDFVDSNHSLYLGLNSGNSSVTGVDNICLSELSGNALTTGSENVFLGKYSGHLILDGSKSILIGSETAFLSTSLQTCIGIGWRALYNSDSGVGNIAIGDQAGIALTTNDSGNLLLDSHGVIGDNDTIRIGTSQTKLFLAGMHQNITSPYMVVTDSITDQIGRALLTSSNSTISINTTSIAGNIDLTLASIGSALTMHTPSGDAVSASGIINISPNNAGATVAFTGTGNTLQLTLSNFSRALTYLGNNAGLSSPGTESNCTGVGCSALQAITTGASNNTGVGAITGVHLTSGAGNTFIGAFNGEGVTTGANNTSIGYFALSSSGIGRVTGSNNLCLGFATGKNFASTESNNIVIGYNIGTAGDNNKLIIGQDGTGTGQQNSCQISGINGISLDNQVYLLCMDDGNSQIGSTTLESSDSSIIIDLTTPGFVDFKVASGAGAIAWSEISTSTAASQNAGYLVTAASTITLPASPSTASGVITIVVATTDTVVIQASGSKIITMGNNSSSSNGSWSNSQPGDCMTLSYSSTKNAWYAFADQGSWTSA